MLWIPDKPHSVRLSGMTILGLSGGGIMCRPAGSIKRQDVASTMNDWFGAGVKIWNDDIGAEW